MTGTTTKPSPRLLFSTAPFFRHPLREAFRHIAEAGFEAVEVMVTADPHTQEAHLLRPLAREHGLRIEAIHAPFLLITRRVWGTDPIGKIYRAAHLAEEVGAGLVVVHPPYRWQVRFLRWTGSSLEEFSARTGVTVAVENMFPVRFRAERGLTFHAGQEFEDLERFPFLVLDTSHAAVAGMDIREFYRHYRDQIQHVHLSNNAGKGWNSYLPVYQEGVLPLAEFVDDLVADGFAGALSIELDLRPWLRDETALHEVLVRNREFCEARLVPTRAKRPAGKRSRPCQTDAHRGRMAVHHVPGARRSPMKRTCPLAAASMAMLFLAGSGGAAPAASAIRAGITAVPVKLGLAYPAGFTFAPDGRIFYLERFTGEMRILDPDTGTDTLFGTVTGLVTDGERGLLGIALHPDYPAASYVYVYATRDVGGFPTNQIIRITDSGGVGIQPKVIWQSTVTNGGAYHQGGRILFGPDGKLWAIEGNHGPSSNSQDLTNTGGKMLRMNPDGTIPPTNPNSRSPIWAYGIRNSFGFTFDPQSGNQWETEAGPICNDEINLIVKAGNYGYGPNGRCTNPPDSMNVDGPNPILPEASFTPVITPVGIGFCQGCGLPDSEGTMFFTNWNVPSQVTRAVLSADRTDIVSMEAVYTHTRNLISMEVGPDGALYISDDRGIFQLVPA